jgi:hypothetical protein
MQLLFSTSNHTATIYVFCNGGYTVRSLFAMAFDASEHMANK